MRKATRRAIGAGILAGIAYAIWRVWRARVPDRPGALDWETAPFPFPPVPRPPQSAAAPAPVPEPAPVSAVAWVEPGADGSCPASHPVKVKLASGIFHVPGGANYDRTKADRCYVDAEAAEADGHRQSKH